MALNKKQGRSMHASDNGDHYASRNRSPMTSVELKGKRSSHLGVYDPLVQKTMRIGAPDSGHFLSESMIKRMDSKWSVCSEVWDARERDSVCSDALSSTASGTPSSWKSLKDVPDWRPSLVTRWKTSVLSVWRHSLTESVCSRMDPFAATLESLKFDEMLDSNDDDFKSLEPSEASENVETIEEPTKMSRAQKRTKNRALRRNRHRQRVLDQEAREVTQVEASKTEVKRKSVLVKSKKSTTSNFSSSRKSVRFTDGTA